MHDDMTRYWYSQSFHVRTIFLLPISWLFRLCVAIRRRLYRAGYLKTYRFEVPVIVVGNVTVGGTGKTPFVIWLANILQTLGYHPGIVSRGAGGVRHKKPYWVSGDSLAANVGDEAVLLAKNTGCPVVVGIDRVAAVKDLLKNSQCDIVISDDGLQHYRLGRDLEVAIVDGQRRFGNQHLLPAGPLREPIARLKTVDYVVVNGGDASQEFTMQLEPSMLISLQNSLNKVKLSDFPYPNVHVVAGIGNPGRFFEVISNAGFEVIEHSFPDHFRYQAADFSFSDSLPIIMTEKDAVKCLAFADERYWFLSVTVNIDQGFKQEFISTLKRIGVHHDAEADFSKRPCRTTRIH